MEWLPSFGAWIRQRRKTLALTQSDLALAVACSIITIRKLEADERRPSLQTAKLLAAALQIPATEQAAFLRVARGEQRADRLAAPSTSPDQPASPTVMASALPLPLTPLIGRRPEMAALTAFLLTGQRRFLTLVGPGGVGKTRLALAVAADLQSSFKDGVSFVGLAAVRDPGLVIPLLAQLLHIREQPGPFTLMEQLTNHLRHRQLLVVLDNFEHLLPAGEFLTALLTTCPHLHLLVTSREALRCQGEQEYPVSPLSVAISTTRLTGTTAMQAEAVQLFVQRAQAVQPQFTVTTDNAAAIVEICRRLDGLPLAIELAAARVKLLPPAMLLQQLVSTPFALLKGGVRDAPPRHQTLRQAIDWSYALLTPAEQALLRRLAIFVGGCTLAAIEAIGKSAGATSQPPFDDLSSLVDKSLVYQRATEEGEARFWLLETIRDYGLVRLTEADESTALHRAHAHHFIAYAEEAAQAFGGPAQGLWFGRLATEAGNLQAAFAWVVAKQETLLGLRYGRALWRFWEDHGPGREGSEKLAVVAQLPGATDHPVALAEVMLGAGVLAEAQSDYPQTIAALETALALARLADEQRLVIDILNMLGQTKRAQGAYEEAQRYHEEAMDIARTLGNEQAIVNCLQYLGKLALLLGHSAIAERQLQEGLILAQKIDDHIGIAILILDRAIFARYHGDFATARTLLQQSFGRLKELDSEYSLGGYELSELAMVALGETDYLTARRQLQQALQRFVQANHYWGMAQAFEFLAIVAAAEAQPQRAFTLAGTAAALRSATTTAPYPQTARQLKSALTELRTHFNEVETTADYRAGEQMPLEDAVAYACQP